MRVGLNLSCGVNETSFTENCYWLDGELLKVDSVRFDFDRDQPLRPWTIRSYDGQVELRFEAHGMHQERLNLGLLASKSQADLRLFQRCAAPARSCRGEDRAALGLRRGPVRQVVDGAWPGHIVRQFVIVRGKIGRALLAD